jgi:ribosomal protein S25
LPQAEATPSEPAQPVEQTTPAETPTAQVPANEPIVIPPFDSSPTPLPQTPSGAPTPSPAEAGRSGRDLLVKARASIQDRKRKKLEKILELLDVKKKITNDEVEKLLHVSDATATRYLSELEKKGTIKQVGRTGKAIVYTRI